MPIVVTAGQIHSAASRNEIKSAEITPQTALKIGQSLSVKATKIGTRGRMNPLWQEIVQ
jgi:hypothetical protein